MKKTLLLVLFLNPIFCLAQFYPEIGVKTGFTGSRLVLDTIGGREEETLTKGGFYISGFCELYRNKGFNIMGSLGFVEKGGYSLKDINNAQGRTIGQEKTDYNFKYITFSAYGKLKTQVKEIPRLYPYLIFGPRIDFLQESPGNLNYTFSKNSLGGIVGFGIDYDFEKISAFLEFQKFLNLSQNMVSSGGATIRDKTFLVCIGLKFFIFKPQSPQSK